MLNLYKKKNNTIPVSVSKQLFRESDRSKKGLNMSVKHFVIILWNSMVLFFENEIAILQEVALIEKYN